MEKDENFLKKTIHYISFFKENLIYLFGCVSYILLIYSIYVVYKKKLKTKIFSIAGYLFITLSMLIRIKDNYREKYLLLSSISGLLGHFNLFVYNIKPLILKTIGFSNYVGLENILFSISQIGMMVMYILDYIFNLNMPKSALFFDLIIYILTFGYYIISFNKKDNIRKNIHIPLGLISTLYAIFITKTIHELVK